MWKKFFYFKLIYKVTDFNTRLNYNKILFINICISYVCNNNKTTSVFPSFRHCNYTVLFITTDLLNLFIFIYLLDFII